MNLVTIKTYTNSQKANMMQAYPESNGIKAFVIDDFMGSQMSGFGFSMATGGVKLQVGEKDAQLALQLIEQSRKSN